jgi:hypothetical protein
MGDPAINLPEMTPQSCAGLAAAQCRAGDPGCAFTPAGKWAI